MEKSRIIGRCLEGKDVLGERVLKPLVRGPLNRPVIRDYASTAQAQFELHATLSDSNFTVISTTLTPQMLCGVQDSP